MTRAAIIGAGLGGLALAVRLQAAGIATTVIEARPGAGGRLAAETDGAPLDDLAAWQDLWAQAGADFASAVTVLPVSPFRRLNWPDGSQLDLVDNPAITASAVARIAPGDLAGFEAFLGHMRHIAARRRRPARPDPRRLAGHSGLGNLGHALPDWLRAHGWRSLDRHVGTFVRSERLRQALTVGPLLAAGNPLAVSATQAVGVADELDRGLWWPEGGMSALVCALATLFAGLGGELRLGDAATTIHTLGNRATAVACASGRESRFELVASNADPMHTAHVLLGNTPAGARLTHRLRRCRWTPGRFTVHFALAGSWPGIAHDTVLFADRWHDLLGDVFDRGVLPVDMVIRLLHPTVTDPTLAPSGQSLFTAQVPVAHLGLLPVDWEAIGPLIERRVLDEIGRRLIPDIHDRVIFVRRRTPRDDAMDYNAWWGSAAGPEPGRFSELWPDPGRPIANLWQVGRGAGAGAAAALAEARAIADRMIAEPCP